MHFYVARIVVVVVVLIVAILIAVRFLMILYLE